MKTIGQLIAEIKVDKWNLIQIQETGRISGELFNSIEEKMNEYLSQFKTVLLDSVNYFVEENYLILNFDDENVQIVDCFSLEQAQRIVDTFPKPKVGIEITEI